MTKYFWQFVILFTTLVVSDGNKTTDRHYDVIISANCTMEFKHSDVKLYRKVTTGNRNKLVYVHFRFTHAVTLLQEKHGNLFEPLTWIRTSGHQGKALLNLVHHYETLSLQTMSFGVEHITIGVTESRFGCLTDQSMSVLGQFFRDRLLDNFKRYLKTDIPLPAKEISKGFSKVKVCYLTIGRDEDVAKFTYICCKNNKHGNAVCSEITTDKWMKLMKMFISAINVLVFVFCPFFIPESYYSDTRSDVHYQKIIITKRKRIKMLKTSVAKNVSSRSNVISKWFVKNHMPKLKKTVNKMKLNEPYDLDLGTIEFCVNCKDLVSDNDVPVGLFSLIYKALLRCEVCQHGSKLGCCNKDVSGTRIPFSCSVKWHECLLRLRTTVIIILLAIPWITRVIFYTLYEKDHYDKMKTAAESRDLRAPYLGSVTMYLSPSHVTFLICYFAIIAVSVCFGTLQENVLNDMRSTLRQYYKMQNTIRDKFVGHTFELLLEPCYRYGIFGLIIYPLFWALFMPLLLVFILFYFVPIFQLTFCLLGSAIKHLVFTYKRKGRHSNFWFLFSLGRLVMTLVHLLELYSYLFILLELVQFVVIIAIYTLMGITLNSSHAMQYVPLLCMTAVYGHTTFGGVYKKYLVFNKILRKYLLKYTFSNGQYDQLSADTNSAFEVHTENADHSMDTFSVKNFTFTWSTKHLMFFVDNKGTLYITKTFFYQCCEMDHYAAPGFLLSNFSRAICRFLMIIAFLLFVGLVVLAFSEDFEVSVTNQMFITTAGGLVPFVLTNFLFRDVDLPMVEEEDVRFSRCLNKAISEYEERFVVVDFDGEPIIKKHTQLNIGKATPKSEGTNDPFIVTCDGVIDLPSKTGSCSLLGFENIKYADDSDHLQEEDKEQNLNEIKVERHDEESTTKNQKKSNNQIMQNGVGKNKLGTVVTEAMTASDLQEYDLVIDVPTKKSESSVSLADKLIQVFH